MNEPDFDFDRDTGECGPPPGSPATFNVPQQHATQPLQAGPGEPQHLPGTPRANNRSRKDRHVLKVVKLLRTHYFNVRTPRGTPLLIDKRTAQAMSLDVNFFINEIKSLAMNASGSVVTQGEIEDALAVLRGDPPDSSQAWVSIGLTAPGHGGELYLQTPEGIMELLPTGGYRRVTCLSTPTGFMRLKNGLQPQQSVHFSTVDHTLLEDLLTALNVPTDMQLLVIAWLLSTLIPNVEPVLLEIVGKRMTGKSTLQSALKALVDPSEKPLATGIPSRVPALFTLANDDYVLSLDNVKGVSEKLQDALLDVLKGKLVNLTPGNESARTVTSIQHPIVLNTSESVITDSALADRSILVEMPRLEAIKDRHFADLVKSGALSAGFNSLMILLSRVMWQWQQLDVSDCPAGMMDYYRIGRVAATVMGKGEQAFDEQLQACLQRRFELELYEYPVVAAIRDLLANSGQDSVEMPVGQLFETLEAYRPEGAADGDWPRNPRHLGSKINEGTSLMEAYGFRVEAPVRKGKNSVYYRKIEKCAAQLYQTKWEAMRHGGPKSICF